MRIEVGAVRERLAGREVLLSGLGGVFAEGWRGLVVGACLPLTTTAVELQATPWWWQPPFPLI